MSEALNAVRVRSVVLLSDTYQEPWSVAVPDAAGLADFVGAGPSDLVAAFHIVQHGHVDVDLDAVTNQQRWRLELGDVFINFGSAAHVLHRGQQPLHPTPIGRLVNGDHRSARPTRAPGALDTEMLCGAFVLERAATTSLVRWLPSVLHALARTAAVSDITRQLRSECDLPTAGTHFTVSRLLELLLGIALRAHTDRGPCNRWIELIRDGIVWTAVQALDDDPGRPWTLDDLASACAVSPSWLTERFRSTLGQSPMRYLSESRMTVATDLLEHTGLSVEEIGHRVGYSNQPAFTRAFKRRFSVAPSAWRETRRLLEPAPADQHATAVLRV